MRISLALLFLLPSMALAEPIKGPPRDAGFAISLSVPELEPLPGIRVYDVDLFDEAEEELFAFGLTEVEQGALFAAVDGEEVGAFAVDVGAGGAAAEAGIARGDLILEINLRVVGTMGDVQSALESATREIDRSIGN